MRQEQRAEDHMFYACRRRYTPEEEFYVISGRHRLGTLQKIISIIIEVTYEIDTDTKECF